MPPRTDFYLLKQADEYTQLLTACHIIEKAYLQSHKIYIVCAEQAQAETLDKLLWTFKDISFIPHLYYSTSSPPLSESPILIGHDTLPPSGFSDILVNLTHTVPDFFDHFQRIIEIIPENSQLREKGREKYRFYREHGCELHPHHL